MVYQRYLVYPFFREIVAGVAGELRHGKSVSARRQVGCMCVVVPCARTRRLRATGEVPVSGVDGARLEAWTGDKDVDGLTEVDGVLLEEGGRLGALLGQGCAGREAAGRSIDERETRTIQAKREACL